MITLKKAQVFKYKSIEDSSPVCITDGVTVFVGKNESGKTAFLEALHKALPLRDANFDFVYDYPRKDYVRYQQQHKVESFARVVQLTFIIGEDIANRINQEVFQSKQIISPMHMFTRTTNYGNKNLIHLSIDQTIALDALKKMLNGLEYVDEVFAGVESLERIISNIEEKNLPTDSKLATFAKEWRDRSSGSTDEWDIIEWHIWKAYLEEALPKFLYFDDYRLLKGKINLDLLCQRQASNQLTDSDKTTLGLFDLAGIDLLELTSENGYENSKAKLEAIGLTITDQVFEYWKQNQEIDVEFDIKPDPKDVPPFNSGKNLYIRVKNRRHGVSVPFDQRSKGFIWFFSFMVWFSAVKKRANTEEELILLLDEPGLSLHALAQADFLAYIENLSKSHQILYTTHSPFMVDSDQLKNVRVVEDRIKEGTKITEDLEGSTDDSLFPLQAALGYSIAQNLFIAKKNVLLEGPTDLILLQHLSSVLEESGKTGLADGVLVPVGGLDKIATFVALLGANKLKIVVLHDRASTPHQKLEDLICQKLIERKKVLDFSMFRTPDNQETDIEDLLPEDLYIQAFNAVYRKELNGKVLISADLGQHPRIVERINQWLKLQELVLLRDGGFNHYRVAQALLPKLTRKKLNANELAKFEALFNNLNAALD